MVPSKISTSKLLSLVVTKIRDGKKIAWFSDFDGTAVKANIQDALVTKLSAKVTSPLKAIFALQHLITFVFATGRPLDNIKARFPCRFPLSANEGAEIRFPDGTVLKAPTSSHKAMFKEIEDAVKARYPKIRVEPKQGTGLPVVRFNEYAGHVAGIVSIVRNIMPSYPGIVMYGHPDCINFGLLGHTKKEGIETLMSVRAMLGSSLVGVGDGENDEPMFHKVNELGGISVRIKKPHHGQSTCATYYLESQDEYENVLASLPNTLCDGASKHRGSAPR